MTEMFWLVIGFAIGWLACWLYWAPRVDQSRDALASKSAELEARTPQAERVRPMTAEKPSQVAAETTPPASEGPDDASNAEDSTRDDADEPKPEPPS